MLPGVYGAGLAPSGTAAKRVAHDWGELLLSAGRVGSLLHLAAISPQCLAPGNTG